MVDGTEVGRLHVANGHASLGVSMAHVIGLHSVEVVGRDGRGLYAAAFGPVMAEPASGETYAP